jgi:glycosyltransferase involved in cell wall biosynthesis
MKRKITILHTIETAGPGGAETVLLNLVSHLDASRFQSLVLLPDKDWLFERLQEAGVPAFVARSEAWYDLRLLGRMAKLARQVKADLIHSHLPDQNFYSCLVGWPTRRKVVVTYHGSQFLSGQEDAKSAGKLWFVKRTASRVVAVSEYLKEMLIRAGFPRDRVIRIYNGIACSRFAAPEAGRFRAELGLQNGTKLVGMVANLRASKGYDHFVHTARLVTDAMPKVRFVAIGKTNGPNYGELVRLIRELGLEDRFLLLGFRRDVPEILADLDVFVLSSINEGFSLATIEAMAAAKPVVVTRSGGPQEIVEDGQTGFLVPSADPVALAEKICHVLSDRELASGLGRRAQAMVQTKFTLQAMIGQYQKLYESCLTAS